MAGDLQVRPLTPALGAEVSGVDIRNLDEDSFARLRTLWLRYKVIFLRDQVVDAAVGAWLWLREAHRSVSDPPASSPSSDAAPATT